ncbi:hypothetical protein LCGC14_2895900, partial [marine sediment metagenome]
IVANEPTSILEEAGIITVRQAPAGTDEVAFPLVRNTQLTWYEIDDRGASAYVGSDLSATGLQAVIYEVVRPTVKSAVIFLPDTVNLLNKTDFDLFAKLGAVDAKRKKEEDACDLLGSADRFTQTYAAGGFEEADLTLGSLTSGSTLDPRDLTQAKALLATGSDINVPDFVLMHPTQYEQINTHGDFAPGASSVGAVLRKARFDDDGNIVRFDGMDVYVTELLPTLGSPGISGNEQVDGYFGSTLQGHPVIVGSKGRAVGRGEHFGIKVSTEDSRRFHGQWKVFDVSYANAILMKESLVYIRAVGA